MATTKIWDVKNHLAPLLAYVARTSKTTVRRESNLTADEKLAAEILNLPFEHFTTEEKKFVSGINCTPDNALEVMTEVMKGSSSLSDTAIYHGLQSFAPDEVDADTAHAIGLRLANELWGDDFPVIVATHIDRDHIHNHFALSATGFSGKRYHDCNATYKLMRDTSDRICREFGLSVIEKPKRNKTKHIGEVHASKEGRETKRSLIKRDIDEVIKHCIGWKEFAKSFQALGYTLEWRGQYLRIRPDNSKLWFRMDKLGKGYTYNDVNERLRIVAVNRSFTKHETYVPKGKPQGLYALYLHYCYLLGAFPKSKPNNREAYVAIKEDVLKARKYSEEAKLLGKYEIHTDDDLAARVQVVNAELQSLITARQKLRNKLRRMHDTAKMQPIKDEIFKLSEQMKPLRKELSLYKDIAERSGVIERIVDLIEAPPVQQRKQPLRSGWNR